MGFRRPVKNPLSMAQLLQSDQRRHFRHRFDRSEKLGNRQNIAIQSSHSLSTYHLNPAFKKRAHFNIR